MVGRKEGPIFSREGQNSWRADNQRQRHAKNASRKHTPKEASNIHKLRRKRGWKRGCGGQRAVQIGGGGGTVSQVNVQTQFFLSFSRGGMRACAGCCGWMEEERMQKRGLFVQERIGEILRRWSQINILQRLQPATRCPLLYPQSKQNPRHEVENMKDVREEMEGH